MIKLRNIIKNFLLSLTLVLAVGGYAQIDKLSRAQQLLQAKTPDAAKLTIDSVILHPETKGDYVSWTTRAYIYFEIYKRTDKQKLNSPLRDTIVSSLKISNSLKPDADYLNNNKKLFINLATTYYNISKTLLQDSINDKRSGMAYGKCKELFLIVKPDSNFIMRDIEYYAAVGSVFSDIFNKDNKNTEAHEVAKVALLKVLEVQPDNISANMNMGLMYYNQAANLGKSLDYGADLSQIDVVQENIVKLAKQAEQFILRVYKKDPKNTKAVEALFYIYRMLNESEKTAAFKTKCNELNIKIE